jgi:hypothetical protein
VDVGIEPRGGDCTARHGGEVMPVRNKDFVP